jgi:hypothetical protein
MSKLRLFSILAAALLARWPVSGQGAPALDLTDFSGVWEEVIHEDSYERSGGPPLGDYQGIPLSDAGRMKADSHDHSFFQRISLSYEPGQCRTGHYVSAFFGRLEQDRVAEFAAGHAFS